MFVFDIVLVLFCDVSGNFCVLWLSTVYDSTNSFVMFNAQWSVCV